MSGRWIRTNGIDTYCVVDGTGPWVVLSHSLACDNTMWAEQIAPLARSFKVVAYDTRGHGRSSVTAAPYSLDLLASDLAALFDALDIDKAHFIGLSMGGMIGQVFALAHQDRLHSLVLCDTTSFYSPAVRPAWRERINEGRQHGMAAVAKPTLDRWFTREFRERTPDVMERFGSRIAATPLEGYAGCSEALLEIDITNRLSEIHLPSLIMVGARDVGTPVSMARTIQEHLPNSQIAIIKDAAHFPNVEQTNAFNQALLMFLTEAEARRKLKKPSSPNANQDPHGQSTHRV
jgi:3-oxoadipate enol-lactonase